MTLTDGIAEKEQYPSCSTVVLWEENTRGDINSSSTQTQREPSDYAKLLGGALQQTGQRETMNLDVQLGAGEGLESLHHDI